MTLPLTDAMIACGAQGIGAIVLSYDRHSSQIPVVRAAGQLDF
jgi:hypothetical protein